MKVRVTDTHVELFAENIPDVINLWVRAHEDGDITFQVDQFAGTIISRVPLKVKEEEKFEPVKP